MYIPKVTLQSLITDAVKAFKEEFGGRPELVAQGNHLSFITEHMTRVAEAMARETKVKDEARDGMYDNGFTAAVDTQAWLVRRFMGKE
jgi:hypothetical protein